MPADVEGEAAGFARRTTGTAIPACLGLRFAADVLWSFSFSKCFAKSLRGAPLMSRRQSDQEANASRRSFLKTSLQASMIGSAAVGLTPLYPALGAAREISSTSPATDVKPFELDEVTISDLQEGMKSGKFTARELVEKYSTRIQEIDKSKNGPALNSVIEMNPDAEAIADALDQERKATGARGPLHGIPVFIKDNIDTADKMLTTAGSLALVGSKPARDSFVAEKLRTAGAVILAKTNLTEGANIRSSHSTSGWSGRGGLTKNPYVLAPILADRAQARAR